MMQLISVFIDDMQQDWQKVEEATLSDMLILVTHGSVNYMVDGEPIFLEKGDLLFIQEGVMRSGTNGPDGPHVKYSSHFHINSSTDSKALTNLKPYQKVKVQRFDYVKQRFSALAQQWFGQREYTDIICTGIATELLGYFLQETSVERFAFAKQRLMREVQDYISIHYRERIRIEDLSRLVDRAPNYVTQTFKEVTGMTPITFLHQIRVHSARDLILNTRMTIGEIAEYLGYSDQAHFNRVFKKLLGYAPSAVQREVQRRGMR
ncbi:AraC family transcriptional regulator [Paenibacillus qinlingensis]|uniref:AraC-like DNA-binding protein n=1 Tax=Paenibacillus qinlingensis TaxID=1837343 RepID=A0ABU1NRU2_9BACL|nr:AraC family transcriptional regulator [Paenibacillus qinlingensis]MDR6550175.1 AraC-like DNA-binding protein [Paenibacillus qinlingensis]